MLLTICIESLVAFLSPLMAVPDLGLNEVEAELVSFMEFGRLQFLPRGFRSDFGSSRMSLLPPFKTIEKWIKTVKTISYAYLDLC